MPTQSQLSFFSVSWKETRVSFIGKEIKQMLNPSFAFCFFLFLCLLLCPFLIPSLLLIPSSQSRTMQQTTGKWRREEKPIEITFFASPSPLGEFLPVPLSEHFSVGQKRGRDQRPEEQRRKIVFVYSSVCTFIYLFNRLLICRMLYLLVFILAVFSKNFSIYYKHNIVIFIPLLVGG